MQSGAWYCVAVEFLFCCDASQTRLAAFWHCSFYSSFTLMVVSLALYSESFKGEDVATGLGETLMKEGDAC